jgi:hypothetical protein
MVFNQIDDQGVKALFGPVGEISFHLGFIECGDDRPGCIAVDQKGLILLVNQMAPIGADFEWKGDG